MDNKLSKLIPGSTEGNLLHYPHDRAPTLSLSHDDPVLIAPRRRGWQDSDKLSNLIQELDDQKGVDSVVYAVCNISQYEKDPIRIAPSLKEQQPIEIDTEHESNIDLFKMKEADLVFMTNAGRRPRFALDNKRPPLPTLSSMILQENAKTRGRAF